MNLNKRICPTALTLLLTAMCLCLAAVLAVGITWCRYQDRHSHSMIFTPGQSQDVFLTVGQTQLTEAEGYGIPVTLCNGESEESFADRDGCYQLLLIASQDIGDPALLQVTLELPQETGEPVVCYGRAEEIDPNSIYGYSYGPGFIYRFYEDAECTQELQIGLAGGMLSQWAGEVKLVGEISQVSLLTLQATPAE